MKKILEKICNFWFVLSFFLFSLMACAIFNGNKDEVWPLVIVLGAAGYLFFCKGFDENK